MDSTTDQPIHGGSDFEELLRDLHVDPSTYVQQYGEHVVFTAGERIFREGGEANTFYLIRSGRVVLERHPPTGPVQVETVGPGEVLGWSWLVPPYRWRFDARVLEPTEALALDGRVLRQMCEADHEVGYRIHKQFSSLIARRLESSSRSADEAAPAVAGSLRGAGDFCALLGSSAAIREARVLLGKAASSHCPVLVRAELGAGAGQLARAIHTASVRRSCPFHVVDCGDLPPGVQESELFGSPYVEEEEEAFPGALAATGGGTLFLDDVGHLTPRAQACLLQHLDQCEAPAAEPVTSPRLVTATPCDLEHQVEAGNFSPQLFLRLGVMTIRLPALRHRVEDIPPLAHHFLTAYQERCGAPLAGLSQAALDALRTYRWPGNLRELRQVIECAAMRAAQGEPVQLSHLPESIRAARQVPRYEEGESLTEVLQRIKQQFVEEALTASDGNRTRAAQRLGLSRTNLQKTMKRLGIR